MADYTTITAAETDPGKPVSSALIKALEENPRAMMFGATGAPRLQIAALENPAAGNLIKIERAGVVSTTLTSFQSVLAFRVMQSGAIRITFDHRRNSGGTSEARVTINGSQVYLQSTSSTTFQARTTDQNIAVGDIIAIQHRQVTGGFGFEAEIRDMRIRTSAATIIPFDPNTQFTVSA